jgi:uncharacterized membrane protein
MTMEPGALTRSAGHWVFAATMIGLGLWSLIHGDFAAIWQPVPKSWPGREALIYLSGLVALGSGVGLIGRRTAAWAAGTLTAWLLLWMLALKVPGLFATPSEAAAWESCGETAVLVAAAWVLFARFAGDRNWPPLGFVTGEKGTRIASVLYGLALIAFGVAHLAYIKSTAALVPAWLPAHTAWVYFTGLTYIAAGAAILAGTLARLAATLVALQIGLFTLLVWVPAVAGGSADASQWSETVISWALTTAGWVMAESYGGTRWLAIGRWGFLRSSGV